MARKMGWEGWFKQGILHQQRLRVHFLDGGFLSSLAFLHSFSIPYFLLSPISHFSLLPLVSILHTETPPEQIGNPILNCGHWSSSTDCQALYQPRRLSPSSKLYWDWILG